MCLLVVGRQRLGTHVDLAVAAFSSGSSWLCCCKCDHGNAAGVEMVKTDIWKWLVYGIYLCRMAKVTKKAPIYNDDQYHIIS